MSDRWARILVSVDAVGCGGSVEPRADGPGPTEGAAPDVAGPTGAAKPLHCELAPASDYAVGFGRTAERLKYTVSSIVLGPKLTSGTYTFFTPEVGEVSARIFTVELRDASGAVAATARYDWQSAVATRAPYTFVFDDYLSMSVVCDRSLLDSKEPGGCSMNLFYAWKLFDGAARLRVECSP